MIPFVSCLISFKLEQIRRTSNRVSSVFLLHSSKSLILAIYNWSVSLKRLQITGPVNKDDNKAL